TQAQTFIFFFQAEDGIRDRTVTGVQTCALPICPSASAPKKYKPPVTPSSVGSRLTGTSAVAYSRTMRPVCRPSTSETDSIARPRSEERRVGKEWRARRAEEH